jgi:hypothetical protein
MGIASLVLGIISTIISLVPICGIIAVLPALVGIILGFIDLIVKRKKQKTKGVSITGVLLSFFSIVIIVVWFLMLGLALKSGKLQESFEKLGKEIQLEIDNEIEYKD